jgi:hypothetical protein
MVATFIIHGCSALIDNCLIVHNYQSNHAKGIGIFLENSGDSKIF